jgi:hypothetical protein
MDYLKRSARMSRKDGITKETSRTKMGMKDILQETEEQQ